MQFTKLFNTKYGLCYLTCFDYRIDLLCSLVVNYKTEIMKKIKLECSNGWVEIERVIDEDSYKEGVKLTTDIDDGELSLTLSYDCKDKAYTSFKNLYKSNPDELKSAILQMIGF